MLFNYTSKPILTVQWGKYALPEWLFFSFTDRKKFVSPAATFNPATALQDNPWQSLLPPSATLKPKTVVLTFDIYKKEHTEEQWLALIHWLKQQQFSVYLCTQDQNNVVRLLPADNAETTFILLKQLTSFNKKQDYKSLAQQYNIPRDHVVILDKSNLAEFLQCVDIPVYSYQDNNEVFSTGAFITARPQILGIPTRSEDGFIKNKVMKRQDFECEKDLKDYQAQTLIDKSQYNKPPFEY